MTTIEQLDRRVADTVTACEQFAEHVRAYITVQHNVGWEYADDGLNRILS